MLTNDQFAKSATFKKLMDGKAVWHCEWCGEEVTFDDLTGAGDVLDRIRAHSIDCLQNPRFRHGAGTDDKEIAKGSFGRCCEWCGEEKIDKNVLGAKRRLESAREHNLHCRCNPLAGDR